MTTTTFFSPQELERIEKAVQKAETEISGEIVPVFVAQSDEYEIANLRSGLTFSISSAVIWLILYEFSKLWEMNWFYAPETLILLMTISFCAGFFLAYFFPSFRIRFMLAKEIYTAVDKQAALTFLREDVFNTSQRTGVLIYISLLEHRVEVLGDTGISAKVTPEEWNRVLEYILKGLKGKDKADGICKAIDATRYLLLEKGFAIRADDKNELPDNLRL